MYRKFIEVSCALFIFVLRHKLRQLRTIFSYLLSHQMPCCALTVGVTWLTVQLPHAYSWQSANLPTTPTSIGRLLKVVVPDGHASKSMVCLVILQWPRLSAEFCQCRRRFDVKEKSVVLNKYFFFGGGGGDLCRAHSSIELQDIVLVGRIIGE